MPTYSFGEARLRCSKQLPYMTKHVMSLIPVERPGIGTMGVDEHMRVYYDPEVLSQWDLDQAAGVILHEDLHVLFRHAQRCKALLGEDPSDQQRWFWNLAGDISINQTLRRAVDNKGQPAVKLPPDGVFPESFGFPENLTTEEYYHLVAKNAKKMPPMPDWYTQKVVVQLGPGEPYEGEGKPQTGRGGGGSGADGKQKPWECPGSGEGGKDGKGDLPQAMSPHEQHMLERVIAHEIEKHEQQKGRGSIPGEFSRFAEEILRPKTDPWRELLSAVKYSVSATNGHGDFTWKKLPRRMPAGTMRLPAHIQPTPRVLVVVDTSGSMGEQDLGLALGVIDRGLKTVARENIVVASADTHMRSVGKVFRADQIKLYGGGGTDMSLAIKQAGEAKPSPDVIVVLSDGITPWPAEPVKQRVVVCLTQKESSSYPVPEWIKKVELEVKKDA